MPNPSDVFFGEYGDYSFGMTKAPSPEATSKQNSINATIGTGLDNPTKNFFAGQSAETQKKIQEVFRGSPAANYLKGISASSMPTDNINRAKALQSAEENLTRGTEPNRAETFNISTAGEVEGIFGQILSGNKDYQDLTTKHFKEGMDMIDRIYDTALARSDMGYKNLMEDIRRNEKKAVEVATANAIALNPYSQSRGAQTAANFNQVIKSEYARQAQRATEAYQLAQRELADGNAKAAMQLKQAAQQDLAQANQQFQKSLIDIYKESQEQQRFEIRQQSQYLDDFMDSIAALDLSGEIGDISGVVEKGLLAGLTEDEIDSALKQAARLQGTKISETQLNREYKQALIEQMRGGGSSGSESDRFTQTQLNKGASIAGLGYSEFINLNDDVKNFYINTNETQVEEIGSLFKSVQGGDTSPEEAKALIDESNQPKEVKLHFKSMVDEYAPGTDAVSQTKSGWSQVWDGIKDLFN